MSEETYEEDLPEGPLVERLRAMVWGEGLPKIAECIEAADEIEQLREALRGMNEATISHVDGRDLLDELHPRHTLDIKRRVDGIETWYEGDWLSRLRDARDKARAALGEGKE